MLRDYVLEVWQIIHAWPSPFGVAAIFAVFSLIGIAGESIEIDMDGPDIDTGLGGRSPLARCQSPWFSPCLAALAGWHPWPWKCF